MSKIQTFVVRRRNRSSSNFNYREIGLCRGKMQSSGNFESHFRHTVSTHLCHQIGECEQGIVLCSRKVNSLAFRRLALRISQGTMSLTDLKIQPLRRPKQPAILFKIVAEVQRV